MKGKIICLTVLLFCTIYIQAQTKEEEENNKPKVFVILDITVNDSIMYEEYRINVEPIIQKYGGKYLVRSGGMAFDKDPAMKVIPIEGSWNPNRLIIIEWDSIEDLQKFSGSEDYKRVAVIREKSATTKSIMVREYLKN